MYPQLKPQQPGKKTQQHLVCLEDLQVDFHDALTLNV